MAKYNDRLIRLMQENQRISKEAQERAFIEVKYFELSGGRQIIPDIMRRVQEKTNILRKQRAAAALSNGLNIFSSELKDLSLNLPAYSVGDVFVKKKFNLNLPTKIKIEHIVDNTCMLNYMGLDVGCKFVSGSTIISKQTLDEFYKKEK